MIRFPELFVAAAVLDEKMPALASTETSFLYF
jgi:hypothetical protein